MRCYWEVKITSSLPIHLLCYKNSSAPCFSYLPILPNPPAPIPFRIPSDNCLWIQGWISWTQISPSISYLTFKVLLRILSLCSFSFITGSLHLFINDSLYSILVEMRCSPSGDRLACSSALYKSCNESPNFSSPLSPAMSKKRKKWIQCNKHVVDTPKIY